MHQITDAQNLNWYNRNSSNLSRRMRGPIKQGITGYLFFVSICKKRFTKVLQYLICKVTHLMKRICMSNLIHFWNVLSFNTKSDTWYMIDMWYFLDLIKDVCHESNWSSYYAKEIKNRQMCLEKTVKSYSMMVRLH